MFVGFSLAEPPPATREFPPAHMTTTQATAQRGRRYFQVTPTNAKENVNQHNTHTQQKHKSSNNKRYQHTIIKWSYESYVQFTHESRQIHHVIQAIQHITHRPYQIGKHRPCRVAAVPRNTDTTTEATAPRWPGARTATMPPRPSCRSASKSSGARRGGRGVLARRTRVCGTILWGFG